MSRQRLQGIRGSLGKSEFLLGVVDDTILVSEFFFFFLDSVVDDDQSRAL